MAKIEYEFKAQGLDIIKHLKFSSKSANLSLDELVRHRHYKGELESVDTTGGVILVDVLVGGPVGSWELFIWVVTGSSKKKIDTHPIKRPLPRKPNWRKVIRNYSI